MQLIVDIMNELAGITGVTLANLPFSKVPQEDAPMLEVHDPVVSGDVMVQDLPEAMVLGPSRGRESDRGARSHR